MCLDFYHSTPSPACLSPATEASKELAAERRELETREEAVRDTGREVGLSLDQGRNVLGRERDKLKEEAEKLGKVCSLIQCALWCDCLFFFALLLKPLGQLELWDLGYTRKGILDIYTKRSDENARPTETQ